MPETLAAPASVECPPKVLSPANTVCEVACTHCGFRVRLKKTRNGESVFCCYGCVFAHQILSGGSEGKPLAWIMVKLGIAAFLAMNVMGFALAMHSSSIYPDYYASLSESGRVYDELLRYLLLFMSAPVMLLIGVPLYENILTEARAGRWGVDGFIGLSVLGAFGYSMVSTFRGHGALYYDVAVMVLIFLTLGRYLEARFRAKAAGSLEKLLIEAPQAAQLWTAAGERQVTAAELRPGDQILLRAGSCIPADGFVVGGVGVLGMAPMTGEFLPVKKSTGDAVWAGAFLTEGFLTVRVTHPASESWPARLRFTLASARQSRAPIEKVADRIVFWMTWAALALALTAFVLGWQAHGLMSGLLRALSVLVIICPCALGAAIPLALWRSFEAIASRGILFKDLARLETLAKIRGIFFDKTGTLTEPLPVLNSEHFFTDDPHSEVLRAAASVAQASGHPLSRALVLSAQRQGLSLEYPGAVQTAVGEGLSAEVRGYGRIWIGSRDFLAAQGLKIQAEKNTSLGVFVGWKGCCRGFFTFKEKTRSTAVSALARLKSLGLSAVMLTGDSEESAAGIACELGLPVFAGLTPEQKVERVKVWENEHGPALVVGEGLNDAPMLAGSGVSLAVDAALDQTRDAADFILPDNDLDRIVWLMETARKTMRRIRLNLFWAFFYNGLMVPLAMMGKINPVVAALTMIFSSVFIIVQSMRKG